MTCLSAVITVDLLKALEGKLPLCGVWSNIVSALCHKRHNPINRCVEVTCNPVNMTEPTNEPQQPSDFRGYAVLVTNIDFPIITEFDKDQCSGDPTRRGGHADDTNLQFIFNTKLNFELLDNRTYKNVARHCCDKTFPEFWIHDDMPPSDQCGCLCCKIQNTDHSKSECFVLAISTHGLLVDGNQEICFSDDMFGNWTRLSEIIDVLNDDNCKTLKGKPRIILLQLCRSDPDVPKDKQDAVWHDKGHSLDETKPDETRFKELRVSDKNNGTGGNFETNTNNKKEEEFSKFGNTKEIEDAFKVAEIEPVINEEYLYGMEEALLNLPKNFLVIFPTVAGKRAMHNLTHGSWLIQELRNVVENYDFKENPEMNFLSVLTKAVGRVAREQEGRRGEKNAVCIVHRLLQPLIFKNIPDAVEGGPDFVEDKPAPLF